MMKVSVPTHHCLGFTFFRDCSSSRWMSFSTAMPRRTPGRGRDTQRSREVCRVKQLHWQQ